MNIYDSLFILMWMASGLCSLIFWWVKSDSDVSLVAAVCYPILSCILGGPIVFVGSWLIIGNKPLNDLVNNISKSLK